MYSWTMSTRIELVMWNGDISFIPSVVSGKLATNTVEFNSRKVSCFQLSIYCLCRSTFHYAMREWAEFSIFDVRTDSCLC